MQTFVYRARFELGEKRGIVVSFPDVPEAITQGRDEADAAVQAQEAFGLALLTYPARGKNLVAIPVDPEVAAKLAVLEAFRESGLSKSALGRRLGKDEKEVRRILDPRHPTKLGALTETLRALGQVLVMATARAA